MAKIVSTGSTLSSPEFLEKRRRERRHRLIYWTAGFVVLIIALIILSRREIMLISSIEVAGATVVRHDDVESVTRELLAGHYLYLVPRANALFYPRQEIEETLLKTFPRFSSVDAALEGLNKLKVSAMEREPFGLYCASASRPEDATECYFLDEEGFIFSLSPSFSGSVYFVYASLPPLEVPLGRAFLPPSEFKALSRFIESLKALGLRPLSLEAGEGEFKIILPEGAYLVWRRESSLSLIYSNLEAFLNNETIRAQANFLERVRELDLRTDNKVFYTFK